MPENFPSHLVRRTSDERDESILLYQVPYEAVNFKAENGLLSFDTDKVSYDEPLPEGDWVVDGWYNDQPTEIKLLILSPRFRDGKTIEERDSWLLRLFRSLRFREDTTLILRERWIKIQ